MKIDGKTLAQEIIADLKKKREKYPYKIRVNIISLSSGKDNLSFTKIKQNVAKELDIDCRIYQISPEIKTSDLRQRVNILCRAPYTRGLIVQLPLPKSINTQYIIDAILPRLDIDCLTSKNLGKFYTKKYLIQPPVVNALEYVKKKYKLDFQNKNILVIGQGMLVGKPVSLWLTNQCLSFVSANKTTQDLNNYIRQADIIISGAGEAALIKYDDVKQNSIIFDFGCSEINGSLNGDCEKNNDFENKCQIFTPVPGGMGPIVVASLFQNLFTLLENRR